MEGNKKRIGMVGQMFFLILSHVYSTIDECVASTNYHVLDDSNMKLVHVQVLTRHGARSPLDPFLPITHRGAWQCDSSDSHAPRIEAVPLDLPRRVRHVLDPRMAEYPPNCRLGDLIIEGTEQHINLGHSYRSYLVDKLKFLSENLDPTEIYVRATAYDRTYRSALSFLAGLYPPATMAEMIDIITGSPTIDPLRPHKEVCADIKALYSQFINSDSFKAFLLQTVSAIQPALTYLNESSVEPSRLDKVCDWVTTMYCNDKMMGPGITSDVISSCRRFQGKMLYGLYGMNDESRGTGFSYGMREMFRILDEFISGASSSKFALLSAHDSTVAAFLSALGYSHEYIPPLASHVAMEIYLKGSEHYVRFVLNGQPIPLKHFNNQVIVGLHEFRQAITPIINKCPEMP